MVWKACVRIATPERVPFCLFAELVLAHSRSVLVWGDFVVSFRYNFYSYTSTVRAVPIAPNNSGLPTILDFFPKQKRRSHATADAFRRNFVPKVSEMTFLLQKDEGNLF